MDMATRQFNKLWVEDDFDTAEESIMAQMPDYESYLEEKAKVQLLGKDALPEMRFIYVEPFITQEQERHLFRQYNFLKYKFKKLGESEYLEKIKALKHLLVCTHGRMVVSQAKKRSNNFESACSDGYYGLALAVDSFDYRKNIRFGTYAWMVVKDMICRYRKEEIDCLLLTNQEQWADMWQESSCPDEDKEIKEHVDFLLKSVFSKELNVLKFHYNENMTFSQIAKLLKMSKENVRRMKQSGLKRIRSFAERCGIYG
jgi:RNA polymerase sigma factor (sigma-70 family)